MAFEKGEIVKCIADGGILGVVKGELYEVVTLPDAKSRLMAVKGEGRMLPTATFEDNLAPVKEEPVNPAVKVTIGGVDILPDKLEGIRGEVMRVANYSEGVLAFLDGIPLEKLEDYLTHRKIIEDAEYNKHGEELRIKDSERKLKELFE